MTYDLAIIGGGPAGAAAGVYAARKRLKTAVIAKDWIGQSSVSEKIENWVGTTAISGIELSKNLEKHVKAYADGIIDFKEGESCLKIEHDHQAVPDDAKNFKITTDESAYAAKTILIASGSKRRRIEIPGADKYEHKGLTYCATCDGPLYAGQDVAVIGGGNAAFESAAQLLAYCKSVTILNRSGRFRADPGTVEAVSKDPKVKVLAFAVPKEVKGGKFVTSIVYTDTESGKDIEISVTGIFIEIGAIPNTDFAKDIVAVNGTDHIIVNAKDQRASADGIWAAGDCTDGLYHQNNIAAGDAVKAIEDIYSWLKAR